MKNIYRIALIIVESTSIPLLVLGLIYLITGYQLLNPGLRLIPGARLIHADRLLRISLITLAMLHGYLGSLLLVARRAGRGVIRDIVTIALTAMIIVIVSIVVYAELSIK